MARRSHGCSYTASVDPVDMELITNVAAANNNMQISLKNLPNVVSSYILDEARVETFVFKIGRHSWQNEQASNVVGEVTYLTENAHGTYTDAPISINALASIAYFCNV